MHFGQLNKVCQISSRPLSIAWTSPIVLSAVLKGSSGSGFFSRSLRGLCSVHSLTASDRSRKLTSSTMSGEQRRHLSHGDSTRPRVESLRPQLASPSAVPSIETPEQVNLPARPIVLTPQTPSQTPQFRVPESPGSGAKVAIPRLKRSIDAASEGSSRLGARARVNRACEPCRQRKTKCSGEQPVCRHCQDFKIACFYADGKRDRVKKYVGQQGATSSSPHADQG